MGTFRDEQEIVTSRIIISLELNPDSLQAHIIRTNQTSIITQTTKSIINKNDVDLILNNILNNDFRDNIEYFKNKFGLMHQQITFSYGPHLRVYIKTHRFKSGNSGQPAHYK